ncbi:AbfB domain-containing protein [Methylobacterium sp. J-076]|uniref:AbfB domain-containing protein n=1 Tax=Methylobacterium sp. J-076 TaxID=2836655 RepID=UPI001FB8C5EF|nr:AbfB domain-containing protein [Methylobacterium sp. J-076]MCJ2013900.1 AbfB domain-containing protein [Methylobacterium sp. J-076]
MSNQNAEVYYPPYLFTAGNGAAALAPRPQVVSLSALQVSHGQSLQFELASQNGLSQVVLVGTSLVTYSFNSTQRRYSASFSQSGNAVTVQAPASGNVAPPGYYQLVAIDRNGVPSPGIIVALGDGVAAPAQATSYVAQAATGTGGTGTGGTGTGGTGTGGTGTGGTGTGTGTTGGAVTAAGTPVSLQASNFPTYYLMNAGGTVKLAVPGSTADRQQATFRVVTGLTGQGVSFASSTTAGQYLRHQNFQGYVQGNDGSDGFKQDATFTQVNSLAGSCSCTSGQCVSYQSVNYPGMYLRHRNFSLGLAQPDGSDLFKQDASFCVAPPQDGSAADEVLRASHSNLCLSGPTGGTGDATSVTQQTCTGAAEQRWRRQPANGGTAFINVASGRCLDLNLSNPPVGAGTQIFQWACNGGTNQSWTPKAQGSGNALVSAYANYCVDVWGASTQAGAGVAAWNCHGGGNQTFLSR